MVPLIPAKMVVKPLTATLFADDFFFSKAGLIVMMSATVLDFETFLRNLGISRDEAECVAVDSDFPPENRPIYLKYAGYMNYRNIESTLPRLANYVEWAMKEHANEKGIVHCVSFKVASYLVQELSKRGFGGRILSHGTESGCSREGIIETHIKSPGPTVLFSPSMGEGLDLKDDLSRFQVIAKVPYKALDVYVKARMQRDPDWYNLQTALAIVQATGRSVRSKTDKAVTYIFDRDFESFVHKAGHMLPKWWVDAIVG
jgi:Rad3-related DNA helicase